jgi:hypothetical protein
MPVIYKILVEVKVLHEFYLTQTDGQTIFNLPAQSDRIEFLRNQFLRSERNITSELFFDQPVILNKIFENYHLKLLPAYAGCKIAIEVKRQTLPDGTVVYTPKVPLPEDLNIFLLLTKINDTPDAYTNTRMKRTNNSVYYFSNENIPDGKTFPSLSNPISAFDAALAYEQGDPASFGPNDIREFYIDKNGNSQWLSVAGNGFVNENDRILFPRRFYYLFSAGENVTEAEVILKDKNGNPVVISRDQNGGTKSKLTFKSANPLQKIRLDFSTGDAAFVPSSQVSDDLVYMLEITDNNGVTKSSRLIFFEDDAVLRSSWAAINIKPRVVNTDFNLLDNSGFLITRRMPDNSIVPAPVFEIRVKSRLSFWRYIHDKKNKLKNEHPDFLFVQNDNLVSEIPRPLTYSLTLFKKPDNSLHYLPNPLPFHPVKLESNKLYADIVVPESDLFPLEP